MLLYVSSSIDAEKRIPLKKLHYAKHMCTYLCVCVCVVHSVDKLCYAWKILNGVTCNILAYIHMCVHCGIAVDP